MQNQIIYWRVLIARNLRLPEAEERVYVFGLLPLGVAGRTKGREGRTETRRQFDRSRLSITVHGPDDRFCF
jgi:hypothetical protein